MIEVDYNEYKETIAENMKLIVENDRLKKLYETDKESWKEQMYELQEEIENMKMSYETDAEAKYYDFVDKHESKLQQRIDKLEEENKKLRKELELCKKNGNNFLTK